jgi:hypothetical protein
MKKLILMMLSAYVLNATSNAQDLVDWVLSDLLNSPSENTVVIGNPETITSPYGDAVLFNGVSEGILIDYSPLQNLSDFTIEVIMRPDTGGLKAQRFLHMGEMNGDRVMFETRLTNDGQWYLDAYVKSIEASVIMIDSTKLHPLGEWYNFTLVNKNGALEVFLNGTSEFIEKIPFSAFSEGKTSVGVRQNKVSWYKGAIYQVRITPKALSSEDFL